MVTEFSVCADAINDARSPEDLFGLTSVPLDKIRVEISSVHRKLQRAVHPDKNSNSHEATQVSAKLSELYRLALEKIADGTYGQVQAAFSFKVKGDHFEVYDRIRTCGAAGVFNGMVNGKRRVDVSIASDLSFNAAIENEGTILRELTATSDPTHKAFWNMYPRFVAMVDVPVNGKIHKALVTDAIPKGYVSLHEIIQAATPELGLLGKDLAWMFTHACDAIGFMHNTFNFVNGSINPKNILIGLGDIHDVMIINWQNAGMASSVSSSVKLVDTEYRSHVAPEVLDKKFNDRRSDIYSLGKTFLSSCGKATDKRVRLFFESMTFQSYKQRPDSLFGLRSEFTKMIEQLWGERMYRPFSMPVKG